MVLAVSLILIPLFIIPQHIILFNVYNLLTLKIWHIIYDEKMIWIETV